MKKFYCVIVIALSLTGATAHATPERDQGVAQAQVLPHKVRYSLDLSRLKVGSLVAAEGYATYQVRDLCRSWSSSQKLEVQIMSGDGKSSLVMYESALLEEKSGHSLLFRTLQSQDGEATNETAGTAVRQGDGRVVVHFTKPDEKTLTLPAETVFPMQLTVKLLGAARSGKLHLQGEVFDGTSSDGSTLNFVTLGRFTRASPTIDNPVFKGLSAGPVSVASFRSGDAALLPDSTYSNRLWSNGIEDNLVIDFDDYVLTGKIESLTAFPVPSCHSRH